MRAAAVVVAAGRGSRLWGAAGGRPKALAEVGGTPLIVLALDALAAVADITATVVVHPPGEHTAFRQVVGGRAVLVSGGATRAASVRRGAAAVPAGVDAVAIHDAARALIPPAVVARTLAALTGDTVAVAPGLPVTDTLKRVAGGDEPASGAGVEVLATVGRGGVWRVQTPQVIRRDVLDAVLAWPDAPDVTDDLAVVEQAVAAGVVVGQVILVRGDPRGLKVTFPEDLSVADALVRGTRP